MPMVVRLRRLFKAGPLLRGLPVPLPQQSRPTQHPPHVGRTHRYDVGVQHHERQASVALQRILQVECNDRLLLPIPQPKVAGKPAVMLVDLAVPLAPAVSVVPDGSLPLSPLHLQGHSFAAELQTAITNCSSVWFFGINAIKKG